MRDYLLGVDEVADALNVSRASAYHYLKSGEIPFSQKFCGKWVVPKSKLYEKFGLEGDFQDESDWTPVRRE